MGFGKKRIKLANMRIDQALDKSGDVVDMEIETFMKKRRKAAIGSAF